MIKLAMFQGIRIIQQSQIKQMLMSITDGKTFDKNPAFFYNKSSKKIGIERMYLKTIKTFYDSVSLIIEKRRKLQSISTKTRIRQKHPHLHSYTNSV